MSEFLEGIREKLQPTQLAPMLHATLVNISAEHPELTLISLKALQRILPQTDTCFTIEEQRDYIMKTLFTAAQIPNEEI